MELSLEHILYLLLIAQSGSFGLILLLQRRLLGIGVFLTALACHMTLNLLYEKHLLGDLPNITLAFGLIYPPSIYLYFKELLYRDFRWQPHHLLHFVLWLLMLLGLITNSLKEAWLNALQPVLMPSYILLYLIVTIKLVWQFRAIVREQYSEDVSNVLFWSISILANYMIILAFDLIRNALLNFFSPELANWMGPIQVLLLMGIVNQMLYKIVTKPRVFAGVSEIDWQNQIPATQEQQVPITAEQMALVEQFDRLIIEQKFYQRNKLTLADVAAELNVHAKPLSVAINRIKQVSFSEYINQQRIQAICNQLSDPANHEAITTLFYEAGFNSKASFNQMFRRITQMSPSEYRKLHRST
ncbi:MAG: helix-turn-helix transcriptional regulator [Gammaproteobacteria bacterium]|nr:helix-turn-helix transcriptional regulator [Gammaproteobacteria bacterium]